MLDPQLLTYLGGFVAITGLIYEYSEKAKYRRLYLNSKDGFETHVETLSGKVKEYTAALSAEYLAKKKAQDTLNDAMAGLEAANKKACELNDALELSRNNNAQLNSDVQDLNEEVERLHGQLNASKTEIANLEVALDNSAKLSVSKAKKVAKKAVKKKRG